MRLTIVTATPTSIALGSGTYVAAVNLRTGLERLGHQVDVLSPRPALAAGFPFTLGRFAFNLLLSSRQVRGANLLCGFDMDGYRLAGRVGIPSVAYLHGVLRDEARFERGATRWAMQLMARAERHAARHADLVLAPSAYSAGRITDLYDVPSGRIRVVEPGFDIERWQKTLGDTVAAPANGPTILCVGRMYPRKNHPDLFRAAAILAGRIPGLAVRVVGDGPERASLERLAERLGLGKVVRFLGQLPLQALAREYLSCDVFCLPSLQEGFGIVFAEAMTAGKPIAAMRAGAVPELVRDGINGCLAAPGDERGLADALGRILTDPALAKRMGNANREYAESRFGLVPAARRFVSVVEELL